jgi:hypothetical protein
MGLTVSASSNQSDFEILPSGTYLAVCTHVVGIGPQATEWQGQKRESEKVKIRFEVPSERLTWTDSDGVEHEGPRIIWQTYTASLGTKAKLRADLEAWRGRAVTETELMGFDLENVLGKACMLSIIHRESGGKTYANIGGISAPMKGLQIPKAENPLVSFSPWDHTQEELEALPEWLQHLVGEGLKLRAEQQARTRTAEVAPPPPAPPVAEVPPVYGVQPSPPVSAYGPEMGAGGDSFEDDIPF